MELNVIVLHCVGCFVLFCFVRFYVTTHIHGIVLIPIKAVSSVMNQS